MQTMSAAGRFSITRVPPDIVINAAYEEQFQSVASVYHHDNPDNSAGIAQIPQTGNMPTKSLSQGIRYHIPTSAPQNPLSCQAGRAASRLATKPRCWAPVAHNDRPLAFQVFWSHIPNIAIIPNTSNIQTRLVAFTATTIGAGASGFFLKDTENSRCTLPAV